MDADSPMEATSSIAERASNFVSKLDIGDVNISKTLYLIVAKDKLVYITLDIAGNIPVFAYENHNQLYDNAS